MSPSGSARRRDLRGWLERAPRVRLVLARRQHDATGQTGELERRSVPRCGRLLAATQQCSGRDRGAPRGQRGAQGCTNRREIEIGEPMRTSVVIATLCAVTLHAPIPSQAQANIQPTNSAPNPYQTIEGWAKMPEGRTWGSTSAVEIDKDGASIWVAERCATNSCAGSSLDPVLKFDAKGNLVAHFGSGLMLAPHGIFVDREGNVWVTDCACTGGGRGRGAGRGTDSAAARRAVDSAAAAAAAAPPK